MASDINYNLLLVVGGVSLVGYFLYKSGALSDIGTGISTTTKAIENVSTVPTTLSQAVSKSSENVTSSAPILATSVGKSIENVSEVPQDIIGGVKEIAKDIIDTGSSLVSSIIPSNPLSQQTQKISSSGGSGNTERYAFLNAQASTKIYPSSNTTALGKSFINQINNPLSVFGK